MSTTSAGDRNSSTFIARGSEFRHHCKCLVVIQCLGILSTLAAFVFLVRANSSFPPIVAFTSDHRALTGQPHVLAMTDARFHALATDIIEAALTRTDKGLAPELAPFLTPDSEGKLRAQSERARPNSAAGFAQEFSIDEKDGLRLVHGNASEARAMARGTMTSKTPEGISKNRFYWAAQFAVFSPTVENPLGWRLTDLFEIGEKDFFSKDLAQAAADAVKTLPEERR